MDLKQYNQPDAPKKRVDSPSARRKGSQIYDSALLNTSTMPRRPRAATTMPVRETSQTRDSSSRPNSAIITPPGSPWRDRFYTITKSIFSKNGDEKEKEKERERAPSPLHTECAEEIRKFGSRAPKRKKSKQFSRDLDKEESTGVKKSWFPGSLFNVDQSGHEPFQIEIEDRSFSKLKADLVHSFLTMPKVMHVPLSNTKIKLEYRKNKGKFLRAASNPSVTCMEVDIEEENANNKDRKNDPSKLKITIAFQSGSPRKFRKYCHKIHSALIARGKYRDNNESCNSMEKFLITGKQTESPVNGSPKLNGNHSVNGSNEGDVYEDAGENVHIELIPNKSLKTTIL